jgi:hypothetical protein
VREAFRTMAAVLLVRLFEFAQSVEIAVNAKVLKSISIGLLGLASVGPFVLCAAAARNEVITTSAGMSIRIIRSREEIRNLCCTFASTGDRKSN